MMDLNRTHGELARLASAVGLHVYPSAPLPEGVPLTVESWPTGDPEGYMEWAAKLKADVLYLERALVDDATIDQLCDQAGVDADAIHAKARLRHGQPYRVTAIWFSKIVGHPYEEVAPWWTALWDEAEANAAQQEADGMAIRESDRNRPLTEDEERLALEIAEDEQYERFTPKLRSLLVEERCADLDRRTRYRIERRVEYIFASDIQPRRDAERAQRVQEMLAQRMTKVAIARELGLTKDGLDRVLRTGRFSQSSEV